MAKVEVKTKRQIETAAHFTAAPYLPQAVRQPEFTSGFHNSVPAVEWLCPHLGQAWRNWLVCPYPFLFVIQESPTKGGGPACASKSKDHLGRSSKASGTHGVNLLPFGSYGLEREVKDQQETHGSVWRGRHAQHSVWRNARMKTEAT